MSENDTLTPSRPWDADEFPAELSGGTLMIDLRAIQENYRFLSNLTKPSECGAAVKADAYGLGMIPVSQALWSAGCRTFFVALPGEGAKLRASLPEASIYVLGGLMPNSAPFLAEHGLQPVLTSP